MAQSNEGQKEPSKFPNANQGQGMGAKKNSSISASKSASGASRVFKGPKQEYSGVTEKYVNKKASDF